MYLFIFLMSILFFYQSFRIYKRNTLLLVKTECKNEDAVCTEKRGVTYNRMFYFNNKGEEITKILTCSFIQPFFLYIVTIIAMLFILLNPFTNTYQQHFYENGYNQTIDIQDFISKVPFDELKSGLIINDKKIEILPNLEYPEDKVVSIDKYFLINVENDNGSSKITTVSGYFNDLDKLSITGILFFLLLAISIFFIDLALLLINKFHQNTQKINKSLINITAIVLFSFFALFMQWLLIFVNTATVERFNKETSSLPISNFSSDVIVYKCYKLKVLFNDSDHLQRPKIIDWSLSLDSF